MHYARAMIPPDIIAAHRRVQDAAKSVLRQLAQEIGPEDNEQSIATRAVAALFSYGIHDTWYHDCPALVLLGSRSRLSVSGRDYRPALEAVGQENLVTIDLSPSHGSHWGDVARAFPIENGRVTLEPSDPQLRAGLLFLHRLQSAMRTFVTPRTTFHELAVWTAQRLQAEGYSNLDFRGNAGHSIAAHRQDRLYIEEGNHRHLSEVGLFTFEPHVGTADGPWGFKHEEVFFFDADGRLEQL